MILDAARGKRCFLEPSHASALAWSSRRRLRRLLGLERSDRGKRSCRKGVGFHFKNRGRVGLPEGRRRLGLE